MTKPNAPDHAPFSVNKRSGKYNLIFKVSGQYSVDIDADSLAEAQTKAKEMALILTDDELLEIDVDSIDLERVYKLPALFRVLRDGQKMQVSRLSPGDLPREPDENGF